MLDLSASVEVTYKISQDDTCISIIDFPSVISSVVEKSSKYEETKMNKYFVYILTSNNQRVLYIGVTNNIRRRLYEHKSGIIDGFSKKYNTHNLIYLEESSSIEDALEREKQLKRWSRKKKEDLINSVNPEWKELSVGEM